MVGILGGAGGGAVISVVIKAIDNYSNQFKKLDKAVKKQKTSFGKLTSTIANIPTIYAAMAGAALAFGVQTVKTALKAEVAFQSFNLILGDTADLMLTDLRRASKGLVSDFELVDNANKALALGIDRNQLPKLLEVATARSKIFGRTVSQAFNDLSIGIGRQSRMILDNLGIILDLDKVYEDYASTLGKTSDQLTELEKKQALTNSIIEQSKPIVDSQIFLLETTNEKLQRLGAQWDNLKQKVGEFTLAVSDEVTGLNSERDAIKSNIDSLIGMDGAYEETIQIVQDLTNEERKLTEELKASNVEAQKTIDTLLSLKDITFEGERGKTLEISEQKEVIRQLKLKELAGENIEGQLEIERDKLETLRLENEKFANDKEIQQAKNALRLEEEGELEAVNFEQFIQNEDQKFTKLDEERDKQIGLRTDIQNVQGAHKTLTDQFKFLQDEKGKKYSEEEKDIDDLITKTNELAEAYKRAASAKLEGGSLLVQTLSEVL